MTRELRKLNLAISWQPTTFSMYWNNNWNTTLPHIVVGRLLKLGISKVWNSQETWAQHPAKEVTSLWIVILRVEIQGGKNLDYLSLHRKQPCSFTCEDKLQQCSSAVLCWREMRSLLRPALFPTTGVLHVSVGSRCPQVWGPALHPGPVPRSSWSKLIKWKGWKEVSAFIGMEIFAQSIPEVTALDSSVSWELPVSVLFGLYMDYLNPLHFWLILQHIWPAYLAGLKHSLKVWKRVNVTNTKLLCPEHATLLP